MLSFVLSTVAFFVASHFLRRHLEDMGLPSGLTRRLLVFSCALAVAYGVAAIVDRVGG